MTPLKLDYTESTYFVHTALSDTAASPSTVSLPPDLNSPSDLARVGPVGPGTLSSEIVYELKGLPSNQGLSERAHEIQKWLNQQQQTMAAGPWDVMQPKMRAKGGGDF